MSVLNTKEGYGTLTKLLHWAIVGLFAFQFAAAHVMIRTPPDESVLGLTRDTYYNWHKSIGLVALGVAVFRLLARQLGRLPDWAPTLRVCERRFVHRAEQVLYAAMLVLPLSGYLYVMAGGYGINLFGAVQLANPIGENQPLAVVAKWTHIAAGYVLLLALAGHVGLVLWHQLFVKDRLLHRMLPGRHVRPSARPSASG